METRLIPWQEGDVSGQQGGPRVTSFCPFGGRSGHHWSPIHQWDAGMFSAHDPRHPAPGGAVRHTAFPTAAGWGPRCTPAHQAVLLTVGGLVVEPADRMWYSKITDNVLWLVQFDLIAMSYVCRMCEKIFTNSEVRYWTILFSLFHTFLQALFWIPVKLERTHWWMSY